MGVAPKLVGILFLASALSASPAPAAQADEPPPLPALALDSFPEASRRAIAEAARQAADAPRDAAVAGRLAKVLHAWEQWDAAHTAYQRAAHLAPDEPQWPYLDGVVLQRLARPSDAADALERAVLLAPSYLPARVRLVEALFDAGRRDESARLYDDLAGEPAAAPVVALGRGRLAAAADRHAEALTHFDRAIALFPEFGAAHYGRALSLRSLGRREEAREALEQHQRHGPIWPAIDDPVLDAVADYRDDARSVLRRAMRQATAGDLAGAIAGHEAALLTEPGIAQAHANLITLYGRTGNRAKAEEHYRKVLALGFNLDDAHYNYGVLLGREGEFAEAAAAYRKALAVNPQFAEAHHNLGQLLERESKVADAAAAYREALESRPTFRLARFNLARMLLGLKKPEEALGELEKLREPVDEETPRYLFGLSVAYMQTGRRDEGVTAAQEARRLALEYGQKDLAAAIDRDLAGLKR